MQQKSEKQKATPKLKAKYEPAFGDGCEERWTEWLEKHGQGEDKQK